MIKQAAHTLGLGRKLLLGLAGTMAIALPVVFGLASTPQVSAQAAAVDLTKDIADTWQGSARPG